MRDEQVGQSPFLLELLQQVQYLCADGHVQCGDRFVSHNQFRLHNDGAGQSDTLALSAGKFMGIPCQMLRQQADVVDGLFHLLHPVPVILEEMEIIKAFGNDVFNGGALVQGSRRILENHLDLADHFPVIFPAQFAGNLFALEVNRAVAAGIDAHDSPSDRCFTGSGLTYQGERLALIDVKGGVLDRPYRVITLAEGNIHVFQGKQDLLPLRVQRTVLRQRACCIAQILCHASSSSVPGLYRPDS